VRRKGIGLSCDKLVETLRLTQFLSMSLGIIAQTEGVFDGFLAMGWVVIMFAVLKNTVKTPKSKESFLKVSLATSLVNAVQVGIRLIRPLVSLLSQSYWRMPRLVSAKSVQVRA